VASVPKVQASFFRGVVWPWQNFVNFPQEVAGGLVVPHWKAVDLDSAVERGAALDTKVGSTRAAGL
jgi:hypothetical protein